MNSFLLRISIFGIVLFSVSLQAQSDKIDSLRQIGVTDTDGYCIPGIEAMPRPKGISIIQERVFDYNIKSTFRDSAGVAKENIRRNRELEVNVKFPILLKDRYNFIMGVEYKEEEFQFDRDENLDNEFYKTLQDRKLRKYGLKAYYTRTFKGNNYLYTRTSFSFNGDLNSKAFKNGTHFDFFRSSFSALYGKKVNRTKTLAYGLSYSYNFGNYNIYPVFYYNKQWDENWGVELRLPIKTELRYFLNKKNNFFFINRLWGDNYILNMESIGEGRTYLAFSSFRTMLTYEREIYDFLWLTFTTGVRFNINFNLSDQNDFVNERDPLIESEVDNAPFIRFGIFIVPPRKWMDKK